MMVVAQGGGSDSRATLGGRPVTAWISRARIIRRGFRWARSALSGSMPRSSASSAPGPLPIESLFERRAQLRVGRRIGEVPAVEERSKKEAGSALQHGQSTAAID